METIATTVPADRAAGAKMRCARCRAYAKATGPSFTVERRSCMVITAHEGACP